MKKYYVGMMIDNYYAVYIIEGEHEQKVMVREDNLDGFIQCLEYFGFKL